MLKSLFLGVWTSFILIAFYSCGSRSAFSIRVDHHKSLKLGDTIAIKLKNPASRVVDSAFYFIDDQKLKSFGDRHLIPIEARLGKQNLIGIIYNQEKVDTISKKITVLNNKPPKEYICEIVNTYPHDIEAYTQGLEFYQGVLFESTGLYGHSTLRRVDYKTGKILAKTELEKTNFGEGITVMNGKIYQLTWQEKVGFVYDMELKKTQTFYYEKSKEGWGLCNDGKVIYKSDGTEKLWILDGQTLSEKSYKQICTDKSLLYKTNELEYVDGKIYANTYLKDGIIIIDSHSGGVIGRVDCHNLKQKVSQHEKLDVLNGIAYNHKTQTFFLTGKNWDKLFEVRFVEK